MWTCSECRKAFNPSDTKHKYNLCKMCYFKPEVHKLYRTGEKTPLPDPDVNIGTGDAVKQVEVDPDVIDPRDAAADTFQWKINMPATLKKIRLTSDDDELRKFVDTGLGEQHTPVSETQLQGGVTLFGCKETGRSSSAHPNVTNLSRKLPAHFQAGIAQVLAETGKPKEAPKQPMMPDINSVATDIFSLKRMLLNYFRVKGIEPPPDILDGPEDVKPDHVVVLTKP